MQPPSGPGSRYRRKIPGREDGFALLLVLILLSFGALLIGPMLQLSATMMKSRGIFSADIVHDYAAEAALEYGLWRITYEPGYAASLLPNAESPPFDVEINGVNATATIYADATLSSFPPGASAKENIQVWPTKTVICKITSTQQIVDCASAFSNTDMTFDFNITLQRLWEEDATFLPLERVKDGLDLGFSYVANSGKLDGVPFNDNDPMLNSFTVTNMGDRRFRVMQPERDGLVDQAQAGKTFGSAVTMDVRSESGANRRSFVNFTITPIPSGSTINNAELWLCASAVPAVARTYQVHRVTGNWNENNLKWNGQPGVVGAATATALTPGGAGCMKWTVTADVQAWVDGTANRGLRISDSAEDSGTPYTSTLRTREEAAVYTQKPQLRVDYTRPGSQYQRIEWEFVPPLAFPNHGDTRTLSFQATGNLSTNIRYCNGVSARSGPDEDAKTSFSGWTAPVTVGTPFFAGCLGTGISVTTTVDQTVIGLGVPTTVTYAISITNSDIGALDLWGNLVDALPLGFTYIGGSASGSWATENSTDNPRYPYNICDFEPSIDTLPDGRQMLTWDGIESANGFDPGLPLCRDFPIPFGDTYTQTFQALANVTESGSYFNEVWLTNTDFNKFGGDRQLDGDPDQPFSWPTAGTVAPDFDVKSSTTSVTVRTNARVTVTGIEIESWHWEKHR